MVSAPNARLISTANIRNWQPANADPARVQAPGNDVSQAEPEATFPRHRASEIATIRISSAQARLKA
jgi:hypothetical protein